MIPLIKNKLTDDIFKTIIKNINNINIKSLSHNNNYYYCATPTTRNLLCKNLTDQYLFKVYYENNKPKYLKYIF